MNKMKSTKGITLVALVVTIVVLLILAGVTIAILIENNGLINKANDASERTKRENAVEKVKLMLADYSIERVTGTKTLEDYLNEQKTKGELDEVTNNGNGTNKVEVDGYEINIKEDDLSIVSAEKAGGVIPVFEVTTTKIDGGSITSSEEGSLTQKAITINITNIAEFGENYTIEVKYSKETTITKETNVIAGVIGQASYKINKSGTYTIIVTGTKDGKSKTATKTEMVTLAKEQVAETAVSSTLKENGVIDIVWLNTENEVIDEPISPANHLCGLTPIKYNGTTEETVSSPATDTSWYNYVAQTGTTDGKTSEWANAKSNDSNAYFVWIPRYAYKITYFDTPENANAYRANSDIKTGTIGYSNIEGIIAIVDGIEKLVTGSKPTNVTGTVKTEGYTEYIPHPAFQFGEETEGVKAGIWVGKFESSSSNPSASNGGDNVTNLDVRIVPNVTSWRNIQVSNIFTVCQKVKDKYLSTGDSHMMKNTEWGAVAYLAESKYGRNGTEISQNQCTNYRTGAGPGSDGNIYSYDASNFESSYGYTSDAGKLASSTGNVTGIYDMNGGSWEYVAGYINNTNVSSNGYNTNLLNAVASNSKYADVYTVTTDNQATNYRNSKGMKGDAAFETSTSVSHSTSWHSDSAYFPDTRFPVLERGR